jgi:Protein of unknown function (DUF3888)
MVKNMKKYIIVFLFVYLLIVPKVEGITINEADTELCERFAFIMSLSNPIDTAVKDLYKDYPEVVSWAAYDTKILKIKQLYGVGGAYEVKLKIFPYYGAHNGIGEDEIVVRVTSGNNILLSSKHLKTY